ncbi:hypothetical protein N7520_003913 [Penicillium odoratum]|uniref:uncharacterized protein n=1 Tax=Penicillium odoratum TaxID=1167516 RepID=UPI0025470337|nr:uncharacterized protein N7520_003913 [Penicillium odoratum]KAJ5769354.1 hypothetical protein N7520_003913 [Penicillium odoratum]
MDCASHRIPLGIWRLRVFKNLLSTSYQSPKSHSFSSQTRHNQSHNDALTPPSQRLPQSPLLTHPRRGPKQYASPKLAPAKGGLEPLAKNPWALALASPVRICTLTGARIPRDLMGEWGLVRKPRTETSSDLNDTGGTDQDKMYFLPVDLLKDSLNGNTKFTAQDQSQDKTGSAAVENKKPRLTFHMANSLSALRKIHGVFSKIKGKKPIASRMVPFRWKHPQGPITAREEKQMAWRIDMPDFILRLARRDVVKRLVAASQQSNHLGAANGVWRAIEMQGYSDLALSEAVAQMEPIDRIEYGAVLLLGRSPEVDGNENGTVFPGSVALPQTQNVPVFDLSRLLSDSDLTTLREAAPHFQRSALFFRPNNKAVNGLLLSLWNLKFFLAGTELEA